MKKSLLLSGILAAGIVCSAAEPAKQPPVPPAAKPEVAKPAVDVWASLPENLAEYNGKFVTKAEFRPFAEMRLQQMLQGNTLPPEQLKMILPMLIEQFVVDKLAIEARDKAGFKPSAELVRKALRAQLASASKEQVKELEDHLKKQNLTVDKVIETQSQNPMVQQEIAMMEFTKALFGNVKVSDAEAKEFYTKNPQHFIQPADDADSYRAAHILIPFPPKATAAQKAEAKKKAEEVLAKVKKAPADFAKLAAEYSKCGSARNGGELGAFKKGMMVPEFYDATGKLKIGEISGLVETQYGYHIIRRDALRAEKKLSFDEVKDQLKAILLNQKRQAEQSKIANKWLKDAKYKLLFKAPAPVAPVM